MKITDARSLPPAAQADLRRKAVRAVTGGMSQVEAAQLFGVTRQAISGWLRTYREQGARALRAKPRGRPRGSRLEPWQVAQITRLITNRTPDQFRLPFFLWTREAVRELIEMRCGISLSVWTIGRYLARWGFTPQKPVRWAFERDSKAVRRWLEHEYPAIQAQAKRQGARILWEDEMGLRSDHATGRTYGRRGKTPVIPGTGQRFGCNMVSAISNRGKLYFMVFQGKFDGRLFRRFLQRLVKQIPSPVFLILDRHPVHRSKMIKQFLNKHAERLRIFFLPSYSPDLNPDELLNQDVKSNALGRQRPWDKREMMDTLRSFLYRRKRQPDRVRRYFLEEHVRYAA